MNRHVRAEVLAYYHEGAVNRRKAARIRAHLSGCPSCTSVGSGLRAVSDLLAGVPEAPMPDALAARLQMAISTESAQRAAQHADLGAAMPGSGAAGDAATVRVPGRADLPTPKSGRHSRRSVRGLSSPLLLRGLAAAGAVVLVVGVGFLLTGGIGGYSRTSVGSSPGTSGTQANRPVASGRRSSSTGLRYSQAGTPATTTAIASDVNFTPDALAAQVKSAMAMTSSGLGASTAAPDVHPAQTAGPTESVGGIGVPQLEACVTQVAGSSHVLVVDVARYQDKPAIIIVVQAVPPGPELSVYVVGTQCSASITDLITKTMVPAG